MGFARKPGYGYLVYELLEGGDLRKMLNTAAQDAQEGRPSSFPWDKRLSALIDTACGLSHQAPIKEALHLGHVPAVG